MPWVVNWFIKPFTMWGIAALLFFTIFKTFITQELATDYLAGGILTRVLVMLTLVKITNWTAGRFPPNLK